MSGGAGGAAGDIRARRIKKELEVFSINPPSGLSLYPVDESFLSLEAQIVPGSDSVYSGDTFKLQITIPESFPFIAPIIKFVTPIFHPNIDSSGRICLDILADKFQPCMRVADLLLAVKDLMDCPNADDPLRPEAAEVFRTDRALYRELAKRRVWDLGAEALPVRSSP